MTIFVFCPDRIFCPDEFFARVFVLSFPGNIFCPGSRVKFPGKFPDTIRRAGGWELGSSFLGLADFSFFAPDDWRDQFLVRRRSDLPFLKEKRAVGLACACAMSAGKAERSVIAPGEDHSY